MSYTLLGRLTRNSTNLRAKSSEAARCSVDLIERCRIGRLRDRLLLKAMEFDLCIIGAGMIGSSAARHATTLGQSICLIGPEESKERQGNEIFGAYYDEARITRSTASDIIWALLSSRSIARYRQLEEVTGISFYDEVGCLTVGNKNDVDFLNVLDTVKKQDLQVELLSAREIRSKFPYLAIYNFESNAVLETRDAGRINPRRLVEVQQKLAQTGGCHIIREIVNSVSTEYRGGSTHDPVMKVITDNGKEVLAKKVLLATGAFTEFRSLLPQRFHLELLPVSQAVVFAELSAEDQIIMKDMPSMLIKANGPESLAENEAGNFSEYDSYILPPVEYPDGKVYLKLGHGKSPEVSLTSPAKIVDWFVGSCPKHIEEGLLAVLKSTFPDLKPVSLHIDTCVTVDTPTARPYIDLVTPQLGVALGDNGCSAKSCDEIGRLAAHLIVKGKWEDSLPREAFRIIVKAIEHSKL